ncbi:MAG TPA: DUF2231 domain-containing protein [Rhodanobacteraceae bacterium]|nr:DUF2231 domain-containing protein [Rhodanobacteraceae bacterium]
MRHPLHPALVHFPIACWSLATAADLASLHWGEPTGRSAGALMVVGTVSAVPAMLAGFYELGTLAEDSPATGDVYRHMGAMTCALLLYAVSLFLRLEHTRLLAPGTLAIACSVLGFICLSIGGWLGGKLVYTHRLGADARPAPGHSRTTGTRESP